MKNTVLQFVLLLGLPLVLSAQPVLPRHTDALREQLITQYGQNSSLLNKTNESVYKAFDLYDVNSNKPFNLILELGKQADLSSLRYLQNKDEKAMEAYQKLSSVAEKSQKALRTTINEWLAAGQVGWTVSYLTITNGIVIKNIQAQDFAFIAQLMAREEVKFVYLDKAFPVEKLPTVAVAEPSRPKGPTPEWGILKIGADSLWRLGFRGQGVTVGGQDTGYDWTHPAIKNQYRGWNGTAQTADHNYNWHDAIHVLSPLNDDGTGNLGTNPCGLDVLSPCDDGLHGTHTMGTIVGFDTDEKIGVAPEAKWMACRNMERGWGSPSTYIECFEFFLAPTDLNGQNPDPTKSPDVINNSWGCPLIEGCDPSNFSLMNQAVDNLRAAGTVVVVSAGNDGPGCSSINNPAGIFGGSFSVGALSLNDTIAGFSSRGPVTVDSSNRRKPNVTAPGVYVRSCIPDSSYTYLSGTSMAGPHVAGAVALLISVNPALRGQVEDIETILETTATPYFDTVGCGGIAGSAHPNNTYGYGVINLIAAAEAAAAYVGTNSPNIAANGLIIYPNPSAEGLFNMDLPDAGTLQVFDAQGRQIYNAITNEGLFRLDLSRFAAGAYFYRYNEYSGVLVK